MPPTLADALLTRPNVDKIIQENEAAAAAAVAAQAAGTTVNVVLPSGAAAQPPQSGGGAPGANSQEPNPNPPTLEIFNVSAHEGLPAPEEEVKVLSVTAFEASKNK
jgi:hypothetical protein